MKRDGKRFYFYFLSSRIKSAAFSAIMIVGEFVLPEVIVVTIEASAIRKRSIT